MAFFLFRQPFAPATAEAVVAVTYLRDGDVRALGMGGGILEAQQVLLENERKTLEQSIGGLTEKLLNNAQKMQENEVLMHRISNEQAVVTQWELLSKLIGSKNEDLFKRFAQDFTLSLLVQLANRHLTIMYNRYELFKDDTSAEMELQITDKHFFNQVRSINSLSGGETFLVSLVLALGLSDLASKNTQIRSLFMTKVSEA